MNMTKKAGIIGSGQVGQVLGWGLIALGYAVMVGTRDTSRLDDWVNEIGGETGSFDAAAEFGDLIVLAVKGAVAEEVLMKVGESRLSGKTVIDATNPIEASPPQNGVLRFFTGGNESLMERLQNKMPSVHFVKAFNSVGSAFMVNPDFGEEKPTMFICGNDEDAKNEVREILDAFGWESEDMGKADAARAIEPLCMLWCIPGFRDNQWSHAFRLLKK